MHTTHLLRLAGLGVLLASGAAAPVHAQILIAIDDLFEVRHAETLVAEAFGVLENDTLDDESAGENGATAELVTGASEGALALSPDGSFTYAPGAGFDGTDSFVYRAVFGAVTAEATVTLSACEGGPQVFTCWKEDAFLSKVDELGHPRFREGFENDNVWGVARSPVSAFSVTSRGIEWRANEFDPNHLVAPWPPSPPPNEITTGPGPARSGQWGLFDPEHGYAVGSEVACDVDMPASHCLFHDGITIRPAPGSGPLYGAGGYFVGISGGRVAITLDGAWWNPIGGGRTTNGPHQFFGVVTADPNGLDEVQFRELDGKVGQALFIWADDFTVLAEAEGSVAVPALGGPAIGLLVGLIGAAAWGVLRRT